MANASDVIQGIARFGAVLLMAAIALGGRAEPAAADEPMDEPAYVTFIEADQLEYRVRHGDDAYGWEAQGWIGGDYDKAWVKTRGEGVMDGEVERAEVQLLYSRTVSAFWDLQLGARYDRNPDPARGYAVVGIQGLAPYWLEIDAAAFLSQEGEAAARIEVDYDLLVTQRLIATSTAELDLSAQDVEDLGVGSGVNGIELGLRLRYEIAREIAPYLGVSWETKVGPTADAARRTGRDVDDVALVAGLRVWF
jgi:copper resistance protein B